MRREDQTKQGLQETAFRLAQAIAEITHWAYTAGSPEWRLARIREVVDRVRDDVVGDDQ